MLDELMFLLDLFDDETELLEDFCFDEENPYTKMQSYLNQYGHLYSFNEQMILYNELFTIYDAMQSREVMPPALFAEAMAHCGVLPNKFNYYAKIFENIKQNYSDVYNKSILDIGCGNYPALVELIAREMHAKKAAGQIDGMDPKIIIQKFDDLKNSALYKTNFTTSTNVDKYDILMGVLPCEATEAIIRKSCSKEKEMVLVPCGCLHPIDGRTFFNVDDYIFFLRNMVKKYKSNAFECELNSFPILDGKMAILNLVKK